MSLKSWKCLTLFLPRLVQQAYDKCYKTLQDNKVLMDAVVKELLDKETLDTTEFMALVSDLGVCKKLTVTKDDTILLDGAGDRQGRKRVIQRRFNVGVLEAISKRKASTL